MKSLLIVALSCAALFTAPVVRADAGSSCHFHGQKPAAEATVRQCAQQYKDKLAQDGKIDPSWKTVAQPDTVEQVDGKRAKEWKLVYSNAAASDPAKRSLYLFYSLPGNFIAANHTGQ